MDPEVPPVVRPVVLDGPWQGSKKKAITHALGLECDLESPLQMYFNINRKKLLV